jgi:hypothetical protein
MGPRLMSNRALHLPGLRPAGERLYRWTDMILTFEDDGCVHLYESVDAVVLQIEALDAEGCLLAIFDDRGQRYIIDWLEPNKQGSMGVSNGRYHLIAPGGRDPKALASALDEAGSRGLTEDDLSIVTVIRRRLEANA